MEENNYYPFGLQHQGYNDIANSCRSEEAEAYKFLNKEYEDSFALNVTETDFRHYDSALGRFNVLDPMAELAPDFTPYRYGFNNPVYWEDSTGLFESYGAAQSWINKWGLSGAEVSYNWDKGFYEILNQGVSFHQQGEDIIRTMYEWSDAGGLTISYHTIKGGAGNGTGSSSNAFFKFMETGGMFNIWGVMKDAPGFKPNSRKRSAVDVSMNYDEAYERGKTSMMAGAKWWKRYKDGLGGLDSRNSTISERLNKTESDDNIVYFQYKSFVSGRPLYSDSAPFEATPVMRDTFMMESQRKNFDAEWKGIIDSIRAVEQAKRDSEKYNLK